MQCTILGPLFRPWRYVNLQNTSILFEYSFFEQKPYSLGPIKRETPMTTVFDIAEQKILVWVIYVNRVS